MNLIDKYIAEVGKHLPRKNQADIEAEIRSTLEDMLDERKQGDGPADEATVIQVLKEYGAPREVADKYRTHPAQQYLIGPRLFPIFERVVRIVLVIVAGASLIGLGVGLSKTGLSGPEFASTFAEWFGGLVTGLIGGFGNVALVFAIIERTQAAQEFEKEYEKKSRDWDPQELQNEPDPDQIDLADHIATIIFTALGLVLFNLYPNLFAIRFANDGTWVTLPVLTAAFFSFLPWINILGLSQIIFSGYMLGQKGWNSVTRILSIVIDIAGMVLAVVMLRTPHIFGISPEALASIGITEAADTLSQMFNWLPSLIITIIVIVTTIKVIKALMKLFSNAPKSPYPLIK